MEYRQSNLLNFSQLTFLSQYLFPNSIIAGGCFKNIFNHEKIKDLDIFFHDGESYAKAINSIESNTRYAHVYTTDKVTCYKDNFYDIKLELNNFCFSKSPLDLLDQFDFTICKFAICNEKIFEENNIDFHWETKVYYHKDFFEHLSLKRLVTDNNLFYPANSFDRMIKYIKYGFYPCLETKIKIIEALRSLSKFDSKSLTKSLYGGLD